MLERRAFDRYKERICWAVTHDCNASGGRNGWFMAGKLTRDRLRAHVLARAPAWLRLRYEAYARQAYGAPKAVIGQDEFIRSEPEHWHGAYPAEAPRRIPPRQFGARRADFDLSDAPYPHRGVLELPGGSIHGPNGWPFTREGLLIADCCWFGDDVQLPHAYARPLRLNGTCLSLASDFAKGNYGHFVLDVLPRIGIFKAAGFDIADVDHVYVPQPPSATARLLLQKLGIREEICIWADQRRQICADRLLVTTFPGRRRDYPPSTPVFLKSVVEARCEPMRRLFITRAGRRKIANEHALLEIAASFGFERYDFTQVQNEPETFAEASIVVAPHDSGLANIAFCRPDTKILELIPSDHVHPYYYTLACAGGLDYAYIVGNSAAERPKGSWGPSDADFLIEPDAFATALASFAGKREDSARHVHGG